jgi:hypothetical protein
VLRDLVAHSCALANAKTQWHSAAQRHTQETAANRFVIRKFDIATTASSACGVHAVRHVRLVTFLSLLAGSSLSDHADRPPRAAPCERLRGARTGKSSSAKRSRHDNVRYSMRCCSPPHVCLRSRRCRRTARMSADSDERAGRDSLLREQQETQSGVEHAEARLRILRRVTRSRQVKDVLKRSHGASSRIRRVANGPIAS